MVPYQILPPLGAGSPRGLGRTGLGRGAASKTRTGNYVTVDIATQSLLVQVLEPPNARLVRIPLSGGPE